MAAPTQADLDAIDARIRAAARSVRFGDRAVETDLAVLERERERMRAAFDAATGTVKTRRILASQGRGS